jgi:acylphosphatase
VPESVCVRVQYCGRVQGVGFRYTVKRLAEGFPVSGHVRNLSNGGVELVAEGSGEDVDRFLQAVSARMAGYIADSTREELEPSGGEGFHIRF